MKKKILKLIRKLNSIAHTQEEKDLLDEIVNVLLSADWPKTV